MQLFMAMKPPVVLLYTRDPSFDQFLAKVVLDTGALPLIARNVSEALQIICGRGRELEFAVLDFNDGCRGMTLLSAIHTCYENLPTVVVTSRESETARAIAYANGARVCLTKPMPAETLVSVIAGLGRSHSQMVAA
jgi:DNA-binding response OmpR family regulator